MYSKDSIVQKRYKVKLLFFQKHLNKSEIARKLGVSRPFVNRWTKLGSNPNQDKRGWKKGQLRSRTGQEVLRIVKIRKELDDSKAFFFGPEIIAEKYAKQYPGAKPVSSAAIGRIIYEHFPESRRSVLKAVKEQNYPVDALRSLGTIHEGIDFIGQKYLKGKSDPLHFFTRVYRYPFVLRLIKRVNDQTMTTSLEAVNQDWKQYPIPDCLWMDNGFSFVSSGRGSRTISTFIQYLLALKIIPIFIAPKKPWMNGAVEGTNSVFAKKVWKKYQFASLAQVDETVERFEREYQSINPLPKPMLGERLKADRNYQQALSRFSPKKGMVIYLVRLVEMYNDRPAIRIFKELVYLDKQYLNIYVLVKINVYQNTIELFIQPDSDSLKDILKTEFPLRFSKFKV